MEERKKLFKIDYYDIIEKFLFNIINLFHSCYFLLVFELHIYAHKSQNFKGEKNYRKVVKEKFKKWGLGRKIEKLKN